MSERVVARNFLALGSGEIAARALSFASSVYLARALGAEMYGVIGAALAVLLYCNRFAEAGLDIVGMRELAHRRDEASRIVPSVFTFRLFASAALAAVVAAVALLLLPAPDGPVLAAFALTLVAVGASTRWVHLGFERSGAPAIARTLTEAVTLGLVLALVQAPDDVLAVPMAAVVGAAIGSAVLIWPLGRRLPRLVGAMEWSLLRPFLRRALPLVLAALLGLLIYNSDLIALRIFGGATIAGYYAAAYVPISLPINLGIAYSMSLLPTLTRLGTERERQMAQYHTSMAQVFAAGLPIAIGGTLLARPIIHVIFGPEYDAAVAPLRVLVWAVPLCLVRDVPLMALMASRREDRILRLTAGVAVLNVVLNLLLIPSFGMLGAAWATVSTEGVRMVVTLLAARDEGFAATAPTRFWRPAVAGAAMAVALLLLPPTVWWVAIAVGALGYAAALVAVGGIRFRAGGWPALDV